MPTPKAPKPKHLPISEIREGHEITGRVNPDGEVTTLRRPVRVKSVEECRGQWRTHVHLNRMDCWDGRTLVEVR